MDVCAGRTGMSSPRRARRLRRSSACGVSPQPAGKPAPGTLANGSRSMETEAPAVLLTRTAGPWHFRTRLQLPRRDPVCKAGPVSAPSWLQHPRCARHVGTLPRTPALEALRRTPTPAHLLETLPEHLPSSDKTPQPLRWP